MQKLKMMFVILLVSFLSSCKSPNSYPRIQDQEQLSPHFEYVTVNNIVYISIDKSSCNSRTYRISKHSIGPINKAIKLDIRECQKLVGRSPNEYTIFFNWLESFRVWLLSMI
jgi:hypothetical protein